MIETKVAKEIVAEAQRHSIPLPENKTVEEAAEEILDLANVAYSQGERNEALEGILSVANIKVAQESSQPLAEAQAQPPNGREASAPLSGTPPDTKVRVAAEGMIEREGFPIPPIPEGVQPEMPRDLTELDDRSVRRLAGEINAWLARTHYLIGVEEADLRGAEHLLERCEAHATIQIMGANEKLRVDEKKALVAVEPQTEDWAGNVAQHRANLAILNRLEKIFSGHVMRLVMEMKMRSEGKWASGE